MAKKSDKEKQSASEVIREYNIARLGMDMDSSQSQIIKGKLSYALNAVVENFDANSINYQNESGNIHCLDFPDDYILIGRYFINEQYKHVFFLTNPFTGDSQIGYMVNNDCVYHIVVSDPCLGFSINTPIHKVVHKITNCSTEIYWADNVARRYLDIDNVPFKLISGTALCDPQYSDKLDCNQLKVQPNFDIPNLNIIDVINGGDLLTGTYQFAVQYSDAASNPLTAYYSISNPCPIFDPSNVTVNFNTSVGKAITVGVDNIDLTGQYLYFNLAVIKTINNTSSVELVGTYSITGDTQEVIYTGQNKIAIKLSINDIFEKFPYYELADDLTTVRDILVWKGLTSIDRINYQSIATQITLAWETYRIPSTENYSDELNATNLRGYMRDEIYPFELVFLLSNGKQTDGFHIPGRELTYDESITPDIPDTNPDFIGEPERYVGEVGYNPYWKIYNNASVKGTSPEYNSDPNYKGPYKYGSFSFWESAEEYPCNNDIWGDLAGKKVRHHKFPDVAVSPINESSVFNTKDNMVMENTAIFPIGVKISLIQVKALIDASLLTASQKEEIVGVKIVRGNRGTNRSVIAKGILRNVGKYEREGQEYYFPNYPYNDITKDPFLNKINNAWTQECDNYTVNVTALNPITNTATIQVSDCSNNKSNDIVVDALGDHSVCSIGFPILLGPAEGTVKLSTYEIWRLAGNTGSGSFCAGWKAEWVNSSGIIEQNWISGYPSNENRLIEVFPGTEPSCVDNCSSCGKLIEYVSTVNGSVSCNEETPLPPISEESTFRQIFNSPDTSFGQPFLGSVLKLESVLFGKGKAHSVEVKNNAKYKLLTAEAQQDALDSSESIGDITDPFNPIAMFAAYEAYLKIYVNGITRRNYGYSYNSIASYNYNNSIPNNEGVKQRRLDIKRYLIPGVQSVGDDLTVNNYNRESSVFLKTEEAVDQLPFPSKSPEMLSSGISIVEDKSRSTISENGNCSSPAKEEDISVVSYYGSIKNIIDNQWGQVYSYETVDTGFQKNLKDGDSHTFFGGDTFINRFAFKTKLPFFIDNRVGANDDSDVFYDEIGNVAYPKYWHSSRSKLKDTVVKTGTLSNFISYKAHNFDCPNSQTLGTNPVTGGKLEPSTNPNRTFYNGYFYMFAYGVPSFYCESAYNVDLRQAFNSKEGEFWPHVNTAIPDDWVQEDNVSILNDNTYYYNVTFSKQNKENLFTNLPADWSDKLCFTYFPFRAIYSDIQSDDQDNRINNWLIYRAVSYYDFPQNYGKFISIDGVQDKAVLARFENKTLLYNNLLTIDTSNPQAAYIGNNRLFSDAPPIDFADTDLGFLGTQNKMLLKIPNGQVSVDAKRGQIFLIQGTKVQDISKYGSGMSSFLKNQLPYKLLKYFPETKINLDGEVITVPGVNIDNNFIGVGLHGVYDNGEDRLIISKLDYIPLSDEIKLNPYTQEFYIGEGVNSVIVDLTDPEYFCNKSWTLSFNFNTNSWISFHSYIPNYYVAENNFFYSGLNNCCSSSDFEFLAGVLVPTPTTTTTTTLFVPICTPIIGTAVQVVLLECTPLEGNVIFTDCGMTLEAEITVPPICVRPEGLITENLIIGYEEAPSPFVDTLVSLEASCAGADYLGGLPDFTGITLSYSVCNYLGIILNTYVYASNGTDDCTFVANGWYFTLESATVSTVFEVLDGKIINIVDCSTTTTTTTVAPTTTTTTTV